MIRRIAIALVTAAFVVPCTASVTWAWGNPEWSRSGWYVGGGFGASWDFLEDIVEDEVGDVVDIQTGWSANARAGYRVTSWFAVEALYEGMYDLDVELFGEDFARNTYHGIYGNLKFLLPTWRMHPYVSLGFGGQWGQFETKTGTAFDIDIDRWDFAMRMGVGVDAYITRNWLLNLEVMPTIRFADYTDIPSKATDNVTLVLNVGIQYRF